MSKLNGRTDTAISSMILARSRHPPADLVLTRRDDILGERRRQLKENLACVEEWIAAERDVVEWVRPDAGALCCVRLRPSAFDDIAVSRFYADLGREGVRVAPGDWFGEDRRVYRLGFGPFATPDLRVALGRLSDVLRRMQR
jgi:DNA-binding transcriptional MocR family regulator